jgi:hypothetical protein
MAGQANDKIQMPNKSKTSNSKEMNIEYQTRDNEGRRMVHGSPFKVL